MQVQPVAFDASGLVGNAAFQGQIKNPETGTDFQPAYMDNTGGLIDVPAQAQRAVGFAFTGFTTVTLFNGTDNTGDVVAVGTAPGTYSWNYEVNFNKGLYVEVAGTGTGTVWLA
jgi:hypothetical protein